MIDELTDIMEDFPGDPNRTRCFAHILNLVVKTVIRKFDVRESKSGDESSEAQEELLNLVKGIEFEEMVTVAERDSKDGYNDDDDDDNNNDEGWVDNREHISQEELEMLEEDTRPLKLVLIKVSSLSS
jgi:hypothetical protein